MEEGRERGKEWRVLGVGLPFKLPAAEQGSYLEGPNPLHVEQIETPPPALLQRHFHC